MTVYTLSYTTSVYGLAQNTYLIGVTAAGAVQLITIPFWVRSRTSSAGAR